MPLKPVAHSIVSTFGAVQGAIVVLIVATVYLRWKHEKERDEAASIKIEQLRINRGVAPRAYEYRRENDDSVSGGAPPKSKPRPEQIESVLPNWDKNTPAHTILGVRENATPTEIEAAYKRLLKRYHPDRLASMGAGYQKRAHFVVLMAQEARDKLLKAR